jgi:hypothetical protein
VHTYLLVAKAALLPRKALLLLLVSDVKAEAVVKEATTKVVNKLGVFMLLRVLLLKR